LVSFNFSLDGLGLANLGLNSSLSDETRLVNLYDDDKIRLTIANFSGGIKGQYSYVSDPPILADIGDINIDMPSMGLVVDGYNYFEDNHLQIDLNNLTLSMNPLLLQFDGVSDFSNVTSRLLSYITNTITSRLSSISRYPPALKKVGKLLNTGLAMIPDVIHIKDTNVTIEGGIDDHLHSTKNGYVMVPLDLWLQEDNHPLNLTNNANFSEVEITDAEI
jgi:hypothetical protein